MCCKTSLHYYKLSLGTCPSIYQKIIHRLTFPFCHSLRFITGFFHTCTFKFEIMSYEFSMPTSLLSLWVQGTGLAHPRKGHVDLRARKEAALKAIGMSEAEGRFWWMPSEKADDMSGERWFADELLARFLKTERAVIGRASARGVFVLLTVLAEERPTQFSTFLVGMSDLDGPTSANKVRLLSPPSGETLRVCGKRFTTSTGRWTWR